MSACVMALSVLWCSASMCLCDDKLASRSIHRRRYGEFACVELWASPLLLALFQQGRVATLSKRVRWDSSEHLSMKAQYAILHKLAADLVKT